MARGIVIQISGDGEPARQALKMVQEQMRETAEHAKEDTGEIAEAWERVKGAVESVGLYMGVREAIDGVKELVGGSLELGEAMMQAHRKTGLQVETLSTLHYASGILGADFDGLVGGIGKMNRTIGEAADGNKEAGKFMQALGLNAKDLAGRTDGTEIAFHKFVTTLAATENPIRRSELAMGLLGRSGAAQIPVLLEVAEHWDEFRQKAQDAGVLLNGETAEQLAHASQALADLEQHAKGAGLGFTEALAPALTQITAAFEAGKGSESAYSAAGAGLGTVLKGLATLFEGLSFAVKAGSEQMAGGAMVAADYGKAVWRALHGDTSGASEAVHDAGNDAKATFGAMLDEASAFKEQMNKLWGDQPEKSYIPTASPGGGFEGTDGKAKAKAGRSDDPIAAAQAALAAEQAKAAAEVIKAFDQQRLAELEAAHKMEIVSDQNFYAEKLAIQMHSIDAEESALRSKRTALQALDGTQRADKNAHRDKSGNSAEELRTQKELLEVQEQMTALAARRGELSSANTAEVSGGNKAADLANLRAAAELEKQRNDGLAAQIALIRAERNQEAQKLQGQGGSDAAAAQVRALGEIQIKQLQINDIAKQITQSEQDNKRAVDELNDAASKDPRLKKQAAQQINQLNKQEAEQLRVLVQQYDALAKTLGGDFLEKAKDLHAELDKLNRPNVKDQAEFTKLLTTGIEGIGDKLAEQAVRGKTAFKDMAKEVEAELVQLALKAAFLQLSGKSGGDGGGGGVGTGGFFSSILGALGEHHMSGGETSGGLAVFGESGPEIAQLPRGSSVTPNNMLSKLAESGGGGKTPSVTTNIINQTSQPVTSQPSKVDYDKELGQFIIHTVLMDHASNGPIAQSMQGFGSS